MGVMVREGFIRAMIELCLLLCPPLLLLAIAGGEGMGLIAGRGKTVRGIGLRHVVGEGETRTCNNRSGRYSDCARLGGGGCYVSVKWRSALVSG